MNTGKAILATFAMAAIGTTAWALTRSNEARPAFPGVEPGTVVTTVHGVAWHNDWKTAVTDAKADDRPILLLSMFGRLDEEVACANARTLRATLFKDPEFQELLQSDVVPVWEMVREVPKVTIDLGDGKPIRRTIRGNAVLYLCNTKGEILDAFPGVHTSADLLPRLRKSIQTLAKADTAKVLEYHRNLAARPQLTTRERTRITMGKAMMESPTLDLLGIPEPERINGGSRPDDARKAAFERAAARLQDASLAPMTAEAALRALGIDRADKVTHDELAMAIIEADSERNINVVRPVVHLWMSSLSRLSTPAEARPAILEQILKVPYRDPHFGLKDVLLPGTPN